MSESARAAASGAEGSSAGTGAGTTGRAPERKQPERRGVFARIALFVRQVVAELKKVVRPTRSELINYTTVVLVFVIVVMAFVTVLDLGIGTAVGWIFGG
ncbi:preprotein translocase subunit SecE [Actinotalea sp. Marseille-Q4924]|uniref:preprotein translocase subunit SecE n=1 Tax=Actinotalea sp. Marseille-Q4924 TaxID=2866571 RepID=UPI001CE41782|nr:preprotein translocase subunit SecE [Actinotalea sp. Marseille-Q4924]